MKRITKNIIMTVIILVVCSLTIFTMYYAKDNIKTTNDMSNMNGGTPPEMPSNSGNMTPSENNKEEVENNNTPPEKPEGEEQGEMQTPPEKPEGNESNNNNEPNGNMPAMNMNTNANLTWIYYLVFGIEGLIVSALITYLIMSHANKKTFKDTFVNMDKIVIAILSIIILTSGLTFLNAKITNDYFLSSNSNNNQGPNNNNSNIAYSAQKEITEDTTISEGTFTSDTKDENAILITGDTDATLENITVTKTGDSDGGDSTSFYGTNSAILAKGGANLVLKNIEVTTNATGANGVFSYGGSATTNNSASDGTTITINDSKITTTKDNSGGIMTTGGGIMNATNLEITTSGTSSAAIRTDRGGGTVNVDGGTYKTTGKGSPSIYSTANITVKNAVLSSTASEGVVIEGKNSVTLDNVTLTDTNNQLNGQSTTYKNIFLYQSMSGDASTGTAEFTSKNSKIITNKGDSFYITNTTATINLTNNTIINNDSTGNFLRAKADSWGNNGSNGGDVTLNMTSQKATGNIVIDSISELKMNLKSSHYEGTINGENTAKSITLTLDKTSSIKLTGDSYITSLNNSDTTNSNIDFNGYKLYVNGTAIN